MFEDEEEKRKREEEARNIISSLNPQDTTGSTINFVNYSNDNNYKINVNNEDEQSYINKTNEANSIINSINPRAEGSIAEPTEAERKESRRNAQNLLNLMDTGIQEPELEEQSQTINNTIEENQEDNIATPQQRAAVDIIMNKKTINEVKQNDEQNATDSSEETTNNGNILTSIKGILENLFFGASSGVKQTLKYVETANEQNFDNYENIRERQYLTSPNVSMEDKVKQIQSNNLLINNNQKIQLASQNVRDYGTLTNPLYNTEKQETNLVKKGLQDSIDQDTLKSQENINNTTGIITRKLAELAPSIGQMTVGWGASAVNPMLGISYFLTSAGGSYIDDAKNRGMNDDQAFTYGTIMGAMEGVTEEIGISKLMKGGKALSKGAVKEALKNYGLNAADNFIQEAIIEPISEATATIVGGKETADWDDITGRMLQAGFDGALSALIMDGASAGINSSIRLVDKIRNNENISQTEIKKAIEDINKNENINVEDTIRNEMNYQIQNASNTDNYMVARYNNENDNLELYDVKGEPININNNELNITPAVVKMEGFYNVIDSNSGLELYTTRNTNKQDTITEFQERIDNLDKAGIQNINNQVTKTKLTVANKLLEIQDNPQALENFQVQQNQDVVNTNNSTMSIRSSNEQNVNPTARDLRTAIEQIQDSSYYNSQKTNKIMKTIADNFDNVTYSKNTLTVRNANGNTVYTRDIRNNIGYSGKNIKNILSNVYNYVMKDTSNNTQTFSEQNTDNSSSNATNYAVQDISKVTEPFSKQESYTRDEMADIWNNEISNNNYDAYYDSNGNIERYIAIEEDGNNIVVNQYDNNDNVVKSEVIPNDNGRYKASDIQDTINRVASLYDENKTIKGQQDVQDNDVKNMKKKIDNRKDTKITKKIEEYIARNPNLKTDINISTDIVNDINIKEIKQMEAYKTARDLFNQIHKRKFQNNNTKTNIYVTNSDIKESINTTYTYTEQRKYLKENVAIYSQLDNIIEKAELISNTNELKGRQNYQLWEYYAMPVNIDNNKFIVQFDTVQREDGETHFRVERLYKITNEGDSTTAVPTKKSTTRFTVESPSIDNSIPQNTKSVKSKTTTNKQSMQNNKNNTSKAINSLNDIKTKYKNQTDQLNIFENKDNTISINNLVVKQNLRNKGIGQNILDDIISYADKNNKTITLTPTSEYLTKNRLTNWYKRNGFVENKGRNTNYSISDTMYRLPKTSNDDGIRAMKQNASRSSTTQTNTTVDNQGRTLSKQQQEYFKNSKVRDNNGNLLTVYHGTDKAFTEFKNKYIQHGRAIIDGFYLTPDRTNANEYGNNIMELYANIENPLYLHNYNGVTRELIERGYANNIDELITKYNLETDDSGVVSTAKALTKLVKKLGYDGIITTTEDNDIIDTDWSATQIVVLNSNQIKNIDNTNPTSNKDIRFAKKTVKPVDEVLEPGQRNAEIETNYIEQEIRKIEQTGNWDNSIPVTKMTNIRKTIEDYLGIGVQKGRFRQQAYGIYKGTRDVIRTKELKDIDTILHETGHALDIGNRIKINKESISNELLKAVDNYGGYEAETREVQLEEGFAEVIREYTIVPEQARIDYPQTVSVLEGIRQENKDFDNFIRNVQEQTYNYIHQNPRNRTLSNVSIGEQTDKRVWTRASTTEAIMRAIYDKDWSLKSAVNELQKVQGKTTRDLKASENAYYLTRLSSGIGGKITSMLSNGYIDENGNKLMPGLNSLGEILGNDPQRFDDLRAYLVAQRDLEYKAKTLKTGIRTMDSKAVVAQFQNDTQIQEAAKLVYDTLDGVMQYAVNNGLITQENADSLRESNVFYVPMQRVLEGNKNNVGRRGAVVDIIKARTGSELDVKDVLENIVSNSANIIQQVENNNILKALYKQGEQAGLTGKIYDVISTPMVKVGTAKLSTWESELKKQGVDITDIDFDKTIDLFAPNNKIDSKSLITSFINDDGKRVYLQFNDDVLFNSLMNIDRKFMSTVLNINRKFNMPLRYGATMANIGFAIPNVISDTAQAAIFSDAGFIPIVDNLIGVMDIVSAQNKSAREFFNKIIPGYADKINTMYALYEQSGATSSTRMSQYREATQVLMKDVYGTKNSEILGIKEKYKPLKNLLDTMTYIPDVSEQSTRFRVFEKNLEYYRRNGMEEMDARIQAALQSRDATQDFGRTGNVTREINQLIPFSAARVGSAYTFAEKVKSNPKRVAMRLSVLTAVAMAIKAIGYDDDEIEELNQRKKNDNFVLKVGDEIVTIKKPQGILRSIVNLTEYIQDLFTGHIEEGKEGERLAELVQSAIMDNMPADSVTGLVPNMVAPVVENAINKDLYYNSDIVKSYDLELPDSEQYYDYNSQLAIWLGQIFNYSPAKIDNLISGYFAGLGTTVTDIMDYTLGKLGITAEQPEMGAEDNAVAKRFIVNVNSNSASVDEVYDLKTELTKKKNGGTITAEEEQQLEDVTNATSEMAKLNKQIKEIKKDLTMSGEEKAEQIKLLQQQKTDTARQALGKEVLYSENETNIESTTFYPSRDTLSQNGYTLNLTADMKKEYEELAYNKYKEYENQGLYSEEKLESLREKCKDYAKSQLLKKYKDDLIKKSENE